MDASSQTNSARVICVNGRLDSETTPQFEKDLQEQVASGAQKLVCDLAGCDYVSSTALRVILAAARSLKKAGGGFVLCCACQYVMEVLEVAGFTTIIPVYESKAAALAALRD